MTKKKSLIIKSLGSQNILKVPNNFLRAAYRCSATTQRIYFYSIFSYLQKNDDSKFVEFSYADFFKNLNLKDGKKQRDLIKSSAQEIIDMKIVLEDNAKEYEIVNVFQSAKCTFLENTFKFCFTDIMKDFLHELKEIGFSLFEIDDLGKLKSFYALRFYLIALSYRGFKGKNGNSSGSWYFDYSVEEIRKLFDISPEEYKLTANLKQKIIDTALEELNVRDLGIQISYDLIKEGKKITGFHFVCQEARKARLESSTNGNLLIEDKSENEDLSSKNDKLLEKMIKLMFGPQLAELIEKYKSQNSLIDPEIMAMQEIKEMIQNGEISADENE